MKVKTTAILALLLLLLGAYAYFFELKGSEKKKEQEEKQKTLFELKKEDITEIRIETGDRKIRIVPEGKDRWSITEPIRARADEGTVGQIQSAFEKLQYSEIVEEQPRDLKQYDLDPPKITIHVSTRKEGTGKTLMVGAKNPVKESYYFRISGNPRIYLSENGLGGLADLNLTELRDKKLTDFTSEKVESLSLKTARTDFVIKKENGVWKLVQPVQFPASENQVTSLLSSLEFLRAEEFIDPPFDDQNYGLKEPVATVQLTLEKGLQQKLYFGRKEGDRIYVRVEGNPAVASVSDSFTSTFEKSVEEWREKKLVVFNRFDTEEARFKTGGKEYVFKKGKEEQWVQEKPSKGTLEAEKIQDLLEKLETAEIEKYGEKPAADFSPVLEVFLTQKDWQDKVTRKHLSFGPVEGNLQAVSNDDYNTVVYAQGALQQQITKALEELKPQKK